MKRPIPCGTCNGDAWAVITTETTVRRRQVTYGGVWRLCRNCDGIELGATWTERCER